MTEERTTETNSTQIEVGGVKGIRVFLLLNIVDVVYVWINTLHITIIIPITPTSLDKILDSIKDPLVESDPEKFFYKNSWLYTVSDKIKDPSVVILFSDNIFTLQFGVRPSFINLLYGIFPEYRSYK